MRPTRAPPFPCRYVGFREEGLEITVTNSAFIHRYLRAGGGIWTTGYKSLQPPQAGRYLCDVPDEHILVGGRTYLHEFCRAFWGVPTDDLGVVCNPSCAGGPAVFVGSNRAKSIQATQ